MPPFIRYIVIYVSQQAPIEISDTLLFCFLSPTFANKSFKKKIILHRVHFSDINEIENKGASG